MTRCRVVCSLAIAVFSLAISAAQTLPKREFRGAWISTVTNIDWPPVPGGTPQSQQVALIAILDQLQAQGFNAVVFQVRPECDALYASPYEPWSYVLTGQQGVNPGYDPLAFAVQEAHKRGMELHAWFNPYRAVRDTTYYPVSPTHISVTHPEWILVSGKLKMLDPGKQAVRSYVVKIIADVVRRYDVDAVHMDDYFYTDNFPFTGDSATFHAESRGIASQADWRRDNVNLLIHSIYDSVHAIKPWVKFGMSPRGIWKNGVPPGIVGNDNYSVIWCDAVAWLQGQYVDYLAPQLYWKFGGGQDYGLLEPWWASQANGRHLYPGLATYRIGASSYGDATQITRQIRFNRGGTFPPGEIQFTANYLTGNIGGIADSLRSSLYRFPALVPVMPWLDTIPPFPVRGIQYAPDPIVQQQSIQWEPPLVPADQDSATRYAIYGFDHYPSSSDFDSTKNLLGVTNSVRYIPPVPLTTLGRRYYAVGALDHNWNESDTSNIVTVTAPIAPLLAAPLNGVMVPDSVLFSWHNPGNGSQFELQVATDSVFASPLFFDDSAINDTTRIVHGLKGETSYFWRVRGANAGGWGIFSPVRELLTWQPAAPTLLYPANVQTELPATILLRWKRSRVATSYHVQLSRSQDFSALSMDTTGIVDSSCATPRLDSYTIYFWRVQGMNAQSTGDWSGAFKFRTQVIDGVVEQPEMPDRFELLQNYPNPFNPTTVISGQWTVNSFVRLAVYDVLGREVAVLADGRYPGGRYSFTFDGRNLASGVYFYRLTAGAFTAVRKMLLVR